MGRDGWLEGMETVCQQPSVLEMDSGGVTAGMASLYDEGVTCDRRVSSYTMPLYRNIDCPSIAC